MDVAALVRLLNRYPPTTEVKINVGAPPISVFEPVDGVRLLDPPLEDDVFLELYVTDRLKVAIA